MPPHARKVPNYTPVLLLLLIIVASIPVKLYAANDLVWEIDYVPVITCGYQFFASGEFPAVGTLSSVAAYNMPFLVWMQMPVMAITQHIPTILIGTQLLWGILGTIVLYLTGRAMFSPWVGVIAACLFTFSDVSISGSYTAWAQLQLPTMTIFMLYGLVQYHKTHRGRYIAFATLAATAAFMLHFSAILFFPVVALAILLALPTVRWQGIILGIIGSTILLSPYLVFEANRDFADLKAFFTRNTQVPAEVMAEYSYLKVENQPPAPRDSNPTTQVRPTTTPNNATPIPTNTPVPEVTTPSREQRILDYALSLPIQTVSALGLVFQSTPQSLATYFPPLFTVHQVLTVGWMVLLAIGVVGGIGYGLRLIWTVIRQRNLQAIRQPLQTNPWVGIIAICVIIGIILMGFFVTRATPDQQPSYYTSLYMLEYLIMAAVVVWLTQRFTSRWTIAIVIVLVIGTTSLQAADRVTRIDNRNYDTYSSFNTWRYEPIASATQWIADDWNQETVNISYDLMPENRNLWWVAPWNTIDENYRLGMPYDALLEITHSITNTNTNPIGDSEDADYIVVNEQGLTRYDLNAFDVHRFRAIYVLEPKS